MKSNSLLRPTLLLVAMAVILLITPQLVVAQSSIDTCESWGYDTYPALDEVEVPIDTEISIEEPQYDTPPCELGWGYLAMSIRERNGNYAGPLYSQTVSSGRSVYQLSNPNDPLYPDTEYRATFTCTDGIVDFDCYTDFKTEYIPVSCPDCSDLSFAPADGATNVSTSSAVSSSGFFVEDGVVNATLEVFDNGTSLGTWNAPNGSTSVAATGLTLEPGTTYTAELDLSGDACGSQDPCSWTFTTAAETSDCPSCGGLTFTPINGATNVSTSTAISASGFLVDDGNVNIALEVFDNGTSLGTWNAPDGATSVTATGLTLQPGTTYTAELRRSGEDCAEEIPCTWTFTTATDTPPGPQPPPPPPPGPTEDVRLKVKTNPAGSGQVEGRVTSPSVANDPINCPNDCTGVYPQGTSVRLTAKPAVGQQLLRWEPSANVKITNKNGNRADLRLDGNGEITAVFGPADGNMPPTDCSVDVTGNTITGGCRDPEDDPVETRLEVYPENNPCQAANPLYNEYRASGNSISQQVTTLATGVRYCARVCGTDAGSGLEVCSEPRCFNAGNNRNISTLSLPPGREQSQYKMISMPVHLANPSSVAFFGLPESATPGQIKFGTYNTTSQSYISYKPGLNIVPGRGYWYLSKIPFNGAAFGVPAAAGVNSDVPIQTGWNQIGPPNARNYLWDDVLVLVYADNCRVAFGPVRVGDLPEDNPFIDKRLFAWKNGQYVLVDTLNAYEGYWVRAKQNVTLRFLGSAGTTAASSGANAAKEDSGGSCFINTIMK